MALRCVGEGVRGGGVGSEGGEGGAELARCRADDAGVGAEGVCEVGHEGGGGVEGECPVAAARITW